MVFGGIVKPAGPVFSTELTVFGGMCRIPSAGFNQLSQKPFLFLGEVEVMCA